MLNLSRGEYQGAVRSTVSTAGLLISLTDYNHEQTVPVLHTHENPHLSFGLTGRMAVGRKSNAGLNTSIEQFSYVRAGEEHHVSLVTPIGKNINLELEPEFFNRYALKESDFEKVSETPGSSYIMLRLYKELHMQDNICEESIDMLILNLLQLQSTTIKNAAPSWTQVVHELLCDNWDREISLEQIASAADIHPVTVSKYFARYFGCSLGEYRRRLKIERALHLMNASDKPLTEIAYLCAFFDQSHFIRAFKEATGFSPKQFVK
jgi:AraC family transcriptional regulator